jgi:hypothetical protein
MTEMENVTLISGSLSSSNSSLFNYKTCRICLETVDNPIRYCLCRDDLSIIHQECLYKWLKQQYEEKTNHIHHCEICKYRYNVQNTNNCKVNFYNAMLLFSSFMIIIGMIESYGIVSNKISIMYKFSILVFYIVISFILFNVLKSIYMRVNSMIIFKILPYREYHFDPLLLSNGINQNYDNNDNENTPLINIIVEPDSPSSSNDIYE